MSTRSGSSDRLDGNDRLHFSTAGVCRIMVSEFLAPGANVIIAAGSKLGTKPMLAPAKKCGYAMHLLQFQISQHWTDRQTDRQIDRQRAR